MEIEYSFKSTYQKKINGISYHLRILAHIYGSYTYLTKNILIIQLFCVFCEAQGVK